jgi:hypothetical protein
MTIRAVLAVAARPSLWGIAVVQVVRLARRGWWRRPPFLPVPDREYLRFRLETQYGDPGHRIEPDDIVAYLRWCRTTNVRLQ